MAPETRIRTTATHHPRRHAAVRTESFTFSQLIPYIGNKRKLLPLIARGVEFTGVRQGTFVDLFAGSTVVARFAKQLGFRVVANDWEPYSLAIAQSSIVLNHPPAFAKLGGLDATFETLNALPGLAGYIADHYCPEDDERPNPEEERMFFTRKNGVRIDAIRETIESWHHDGTISDLEKAYLLNALLYAASYASNTSGVFKGFHYGWGGKTGTALYRIRGDLELRPPVTLDNGQANLAVREDAQALAGRLSEVCGSKPDIVYIDPPYNQHPYGSNYHVLNTLVLWDKPPLARRFLVDGKKVEKSAIRKDWRTERRSLYNHAGEAARAFRSLMETVQGRWILVSYSTDGNIPVESLLTSMGARGRLKVFMQPYKRYRVSPSRPSEKSHNIEFLALVNTEEPATEPELIKGLVHAIFAEEAEAVNDDAGPAWLRQATSLEEFDADEDSSDSDALGAPSSAPAPGAAPEQRRYSCGKCGGSGHNARSCAGAN